MNKKSKKQLKMTKSLKKEPTENVRPVQLASSAQILRHEGDDVTAIVEFLENFRQMTDSRAQHKSKLISIKIPEPLLAAFKYKAEQEKTPYQKIIKQLMLAWLKSSPESPS
jgi:predicted DNA binding CopG/RHH family protein